MIAFISLIYASFYFLVFGKGWVEKSARNISIFTGTGVVLVGAIIFMWLTFSPTTADGRSFQYVVQIVPNVAGPVTEVTADALVPLKEGDILFKIDPTQYQASVDQLEASIRRTVAQKKLADIQVELVFASIPGKVFTGKVVAIAVATGEAQLAPSGEIPIMTGQPIVGRRPIRISLDDPSVYSDVGQGAQTFVAFYTQKGKAFHVITKVAVRMQAWLGFLTNPAG